MPQCLFRLFSVESFFIYLFSFNAISLGLIRRRDRRSCDEYLLRPIHYIQRPPLFFSSHLRFLGSDYGLVNGKRHRHTGAETRRYMKMACCFNLPLYPEAL